MPHYKDGQLAQVGDFVKGKGVSERVIAGTLLTINPGSDTCNGLIGFLKVVDAEDPKQFYEGSLFVKRGAEGVKTSSLIMTEYVTLSNLEKVE